MSATVYNKPARFPTGQRYDRAAKALAAAYNEVEALKWSLEIVGAWENEGEAIDQPTFETIGRLADFLDVLNTEATQLRDYQAAMERSLHVVMSMRGDLAVQARSKDADDAR